MPALASVMLKGERDVAARFWFGGTACSAVTVSLFVVQSVLPSTVPLILSFSLITLMLALMASHFSPSEAVWPLRFMAPR
jgi:hypothetical protein